MSTNNIFVISYLNRIISEFISTLDIDWGVPTQCHSWNICINICGQVSNWVRMQSCVYEMYAKAEFSMPKFCYITITKMKDEFIFSC